MSLIKKLKEDPTNSINIAEILHTTFKGKTKYTELFLRLIKEKFKEVDGSLNDYWLNQHYQFSQESLKSMSTFEKHVTYNLLVHILTDKQRTLIYDFYSFNERGLIEQNDLTKYVSFDEIDTQVNIGYIKSISKENENQRHLVYENDEYIILRPLSFEASKKYGSNTKWCTTMEHEPSYFDKFYSRGILIYILNKLTGVKVATYRNLYDCGHEFSFWNQIDQRIDSMETNLPQFVLDIVKDEIKQNFKSNRELLSEEDVVKFEKQTMRHEEKMSRGIEAIENNMIAPMMERPRAVEMDDIPEHPFAVYENENTLVSFDEDGNVNVAYRPDVPIHSIELDFTVTSTEDLPF